MSMKLITAAWTVRIDPSAKAVLVSLADQAHEDNDGECWPAVASIAERTCLGLRTVQGALQRLQDAGWLRCELQASRRRTNRYLLAVQRLLDNERMHADAKAAERAAKRAAMQGEKGVGNEAIEPPTQACVTPQQLHPAAAAPRSSCTLNPAAAAPEPKEELNTTTPIPPCQGAEGLAASRPEAPAAAPPPPARVDCPDQRSTKRAAKRSGLLSLADWLQLCRDEGHTPIPADDPVWRYAEDVGLPREMVGLAWAEFKRKRLASGKGQKDWRATFRNAVRGNWARIWVLTGDHAEASLSTVGQQLKRELIAEREREAEAERHQHAQEATA
jgi:hypothetical protein